MELCEAANAKVGYNSVRIANFLCNGNYAVSGGSDGCQAVLDLAKSKGARMTIKLAVDGAFHTAYMQPAQQELQYVSCCLTPIYQVMLMLLCCILLHICSVFHKIPQH